MPFTSHQPEYAQCKVIKPNLCDGRPITEVSFEGLACIHHETKEGVTKMNYTRWCNIEWIAQSAGLRMVYCLCTSFIFGFTLLTTLNNFGACHDAMQVDMNYQWPYYGTRSSKGSLSIPEISQD